MLSGICIISIVILIDPDGLAAGAVQIVYLRGEIVGEVRSALMGDLEALGIGGDVNIVCVAQIVQLVLLQEFPDFIQPLFVALASLSPGFQNQPSMSPSSRTTFSSM